MLTTLLKSKLHRATVTDADLNYVGSIGICPDLMEAANFNEFEKVDIYNITNGQRFSTYTIKANKGDITLNGAAARLVHKGDLIIIASFCQYNEEEVKNHKPALVLVNENNEVDKILPEGL